MTRVTRRELLRVAVATAGAGLIVGSSRPSSARAAAPWSAIGFSQVGEPLVMHHLGGGSRRVFILGGQHGGPEYNTVRLTQMLIDHFAANPNEIPANVGLDIMPIGNPDGVRAGIRQYVSGVDPNRNWGGPEWRPDAYDSNGRFRPGLGGPEPFSEQETRALATWLGETRPAFVINIHSAGGFMFGGRDGLLGELAAAYSEASGYPRPAPGPGSSPLGYRATGSMNVWMREIGLIGIFIELTTATDPEFSRNLAGVRAVLPLIAAASASG